MVSKELKAYLQTLSKELDKTEYGKRLYEAIVNSPFESNRLTSLRLGLGIIVFLLVNEKEGTIDRIALSKTDFAQHALDMSEKRFEDIKIPLVHDRNIISRTLGNDKPHSTSDWELLFTPDMSGQAARYNQAAAGIECSYVYPLKFNPGGAIIFSYFLPKSTIGKVHQNFMAEYSQLVTNKLKK